MPESSIKYKTSADLTALKAFNQELINTSKALDKVADSKRRADGAGGGGGGGGSAAPNDGRGGGGPPGGGGPAPDGARGPTPAPPMPGGGGGGEPPPSPEPPTPPAPPQPSPPGGRRPPPPKTWSDTARDYRDRAGSFLGRTASTAIGTGIGMGLGSSLVGFLMGSGEKFASLDRQLGQLEQRFHSSRSAITSWGAALGYTMEQSGQFAAAVGGVENTISPQRSRRYGGFARAMGLDPSTGMPLVATIGRQVGGPLGNRELGSLVGTARGVGMGQGRLEEFLQSMSSLTLMQQQSTGQGNLGNAESLMGLVGRTFGGSSLGQGSQGMDFISRMQGVMTGNNALQVYLMRAMGYGKDPSIDYVTMRKRTEAGLMDPRNLIDIFGGFQKQGLKPKEMMRALESVSGGSLKMFEIEKLVDQLGSEKGLEGFRKEADNPNAAVSMLAKGQTRDFGAAGQATVTSGEYRNVQLEKLQYDVGGPVLEAMTKMTDVMIKAAGTMEKLLGLGMGDIINKAADMASDIADKADEVVDIYNSEGTLGLLKRIAEGIEALLSFFTLGTWNWTAKPKAPGQRSDTPDPYFTK